MTKHKPSFEAAVGFFVVVGFLILSIIVFFVSGVYFFRPGYHLNTVFDYVSIINKGAPVRFSGVKVGEVSAITLLKSEKEDGKAQVKLTYFVERGVEIRDNYEVGIQGAHIMSEPHIAITPIDGAGHVLKDGDTTTPGISPLSMDDLIKQGQAIAERLNQLLGNVGGIFEDEELQKKIKESFDNMHQLLASMNKIMSGQEEEFRDMVVNLNHVSTQAGNLLEHVNKGEGTVGKLLREDELYQEMRDFVREIKTHPWKLLKKN